MVTKILITMQKQLYRFGQIEIILKNLKLVGKRGLFGIMEKFLKAESRMIGILQLKVWS